MTTKLKL